MATRRKPAGKKQPAGTTARKSTRARKRTRFDDETPPTRQSKRSRGDNDDPETAGNTAANRGPGSPQRQRQPTPPPPPPPPEYFVKVNSYLNITQPKRQIHVLARRYGAWRLADDPDDKLCDIHNDVSNAEHAAMDCSNALLFFRESITAVVRVQRLAPSRIPVEKLSVASWTDVQAELEHLNTQHPGKPLSVDIDIVTRYEPPTPQPPASTAQTGSGAAPTGSIGQTDSSAALIGSIGQTGSSTPITPSRRPPHDGDRNSTPTPRRTRTGELHGSYERLRHQAELSAIVEKDLRQKWICTSEHCRNRTNACFVWENTHYSMEPMQFREWAKAIKEEITNMEMPP